MWSCEQSESMSPSIRRGLFGPLGRLVRMPNRQVDGTGVQSSPPPRRLSIACAAVAVLVSVLASAPAIEAQPVEFSWAEQMGGSGSERGSAVATDASGNVVVAGSFDGQWSFGGTSLTSAGSMDIFVAKLDAGGALLWAEKAGGAGWDDVGDVAVDASGNVFVTGSFSGKASFDRNTTLASTGARDEDAFVAKYDAGGTLLWATRAGGSSGNDRGDGIALDASGDVLVTGVFEGQASFDGTTLTSIGRKDVFVAQYDAAGSLRWARSAGGPDDEVSTGIGVDGSGNVYISGHLEGQVSFDGTTLTNSGRADTFVAKYDPSGTVLWAERAGGTHTTLALDVAVDDAGQFFLIGPFDGQATFDSKTLSSAGRVDTFVAKLDSAGTVSWTEQAGASSVADTTWGNAAAVDDSGSAVVTGYFDGQSSFDGTTLDSTGQADVFVAEYDSGGTVHWVLSTSASSRSAAAFGEAIAVDALGNVFVTGQFRGQPSFGEIHLSSAGEGDAFVAKIGSRNGLGGGIVDLCWRSPSLCADVEVGRGFVEIPCEGRVPCYGVDPVPYNCKVKFDCPGCGGGIALCPPYYHLFFDGLDPETWRVELYTGKGNPVPHEVIRTESGIVLSFRPSEERFEAGTIGDYKIGFALEEGLEPRETYRFGARLERSAEPYGASTEPRPDEEVTEGEDCFAIDAEDIEMVDQGEAGYLITDGTSRIALGTDRDDAKAMVKVVSRHTHQCFIGRDNEREERDLYIVQYWKGRSDVATDYPSNEDCLSYDPEDLRIVDQGAPGYLLTDGTSRMLLLDDREDAERALEWAKRHSRHCFIGRDNEREDRETYILEYWRE